MRYVIEKWMLGYIVRTEVDWFPCATLLEAKRMVEELEEEETHEQKHKAKQGALEAQQAGDEGRIQSRELERRDRSCSRLPFPVQGRNYSSQFGLRQPEDRLGLESEEKKPE